MATILELLNSRKRRQQVQSERALSSALVVRQEGYRYVLNDGGTSVLADNASGEALVPGDRVYLLRSNGIAVIVGLQARDQDL